MKTKRTLLALSALPFTLASYDYPTTLAGCEAFAALFDNTCDTDDGYLTDFTSHAGEDISCSLDYLPEEYCPGTVDTDANTCTWTRKVCVTCTTETLKKVTSTYIRVQTNSMPNRCFYPGNDIPLDTLYYDVKMKFNPSVDSTYYNTAATITSQDDLNDLICSFEGASNTNVPSNSYIYEQGTTKTFDAIGIALDGILMNPSINANWVDIFYPVSWDPTDYTYTEGNKQKEYDECAGHTNGFGAYHYHAPSACAIDWTLHTDSISKCYDIDECWDDPPSYLVDQFDGTQTPMGIAKDGHIIWSPFDKDGNTYSPCDVDICNGLWIDGYYNYVATTFHPYLPGCYGPGSTLTYAQECSSNTDTCSSTFDLVQTTSRAQIVKSSLSQQTASGL